MRRISARSSRFAGLVALTAEERSVGAMSTSDETATSPYSHEPMFDGAEFRRVLGHFPTGVTIVSGMDGDKPMGFTIGSFTSVSLDPPMVGFLPMTTSDTWLAIAPSGRFCVNVLGVHQADLCWSFAKSGNEHRRFDDVAWRPSPTGSPIIDRAVAWIDCVVENVYDMGDHVFVLGRVVALDADADHDGQPPTPLLFCLGALGHFEKD
jgi:3-hydroxy-9,10-secoandrosta-1,3,5(10)-triene-9,17-dione monooxygenase reductase component